MHAPRANSLHAPRRISDTNYSPEQSPADGDSFAPFFRNKHVIAHVGFSPFRRHPFGCISIACAETKRPDGARSAKIRFGACNSAPFIRRSIQSSMPFEWNVRSYPTGDDPRGVEILRRKAAYGLNQVGVVRGYRLSSSLGSPLTAWLTETPHGRHSQLSRSSWNARQIVRT